MLRVYAKDHPDFCFRDVHPRFGDGHQMFVLQCTYDINRSFYGKVHVRRVWFPMTVNMELVAFENSSVTIHYEARDAADGELLMTLRSKLALVNEATRKSERLSDEFREKYARQHQPAFVLPKHEALVIPSNAFCDRLQIRPSDIDSMGHANNSVYIRMCSDCATIASVKHGHFLRFGNDLASRHVKTLNMLYSKECMLGDVVDVYVWDDATQNDLLHFQIKNNSIVLFHMLVEYYPVIRTVSKL